MKSQYLKPEVRYYKVNTKDVIATSNFVVDTIDETSTDAPERNSDNDWLDF